MAAATGVRNDGAAAIRTTKGLLFVFTLLSLVCSSCSLIDKEQLVEIKEHHERIKEQLERLKNKDIPAFLSSSDLLGEYINKMDPLMSLMKEYEEDIPDFFPQLEKRLKNTKGFLENAKAYADKKNEEFDVEIRDIEKKLRQSEALIKFLEEQEAEL